MTVGFPPPPIVDANTRQLLDTLEVRGKELLDVGCGDGQLVRALTRAGARVTGVECGALPLARARTLESAGEEYYVEGVAECLPFNDSSRDIVVFFNSLHHVAVPQQGQALREAARVLRPGGFIYLAEPLAEGPNFEAGKAIDDETRVRASALVAIQESYKNSSLQQVLEVSYQHTIAYRDFAAFCEAKVYVDAGRARYLAEHEAEMHAAFVSAGREVADGWVFEQPMRANLLKKGTVA